jgi:hypothetical protein
LLSLSFFSLYGEVFQQAARGPEQELEEEKRRTAAVQKKCGIWKKVSGPVHG